MLPALCSICRGELLRGWSVSLFFRAPLAPFLLLVDRFSLTYFLFLLFRGSAPRRAEVVETGCCFGFPRQVCRGSSRLLGHHIRSFRPVGIVHDILFGSLPFVLCAAVEPGALKHHVPADFEKAIELAEDRFVNPTFFRCDTHRCEDTLCLFPESVEESVDLLRCGIVD